MSNINIKFNGADAGNTAQKLYSYIVDGGLEDQLTDFLSTDELEVSMSKWDNNTLQVTFNCSPKT